MIHSKYAIRKQALERLRPRFGNIILRPVNTEV